MRADAWMLGASWWAQSLPFAPKFSYHYASFSGDDPKTSPLNKYCQAHEVKNLFVADGAPFVSNPDKNPTHTIVALAWRTAEYLAEELRKANV